MMKTVCNKDMCSGCMACLEKCHHNAIIIHDCVESYNAIIDSTRCINCNLCKLVCPINQTGCFSAPVEWYQGWANEYRDKSASGGIASEIMKNFISSGGYVASCLYDKGAFCFKLTNNLSDIELFSGSKYVKSNPSGIYSRIKEKIDEGFKVLFIGLPCQVAAVQNYIKSSTLLYTIDLICHGTPSPKLLFKYLEEHNYHLDQIENISFRKKMDFCLSINGSRIKRKRICDLYSHAFLDGLFYTKNCYNCKYAQLNRSGDITLGDSWGTDIIGEMKNGVSLLLIQTDKGKELLSSSSFVLHGVDKYVAIRNNKQLVGPFVMNKKRERFLKMVNRNGHVNKNLKRIYPSVTLKNNLKSVLSAFGILK